jgi:glycosyltransferase involved in cell wall biosynthesis
MQKKKLTVIVLAYNQEKYLSQCIDSILSQKVSFDFQILIGNDGSSDNVAIIAQTYEKKYPDIIKFFFTERVYRKYPGDYINFANLYSKTKTDYFCVLDGDDFYTDDNKLQMQFDFLESDKSYSYVGHNYYYLYNDGKMQAAYSEIDIPKYKSTSENLSQLLLGGTIPYLHTSSVMFRNIFKDDTKFHDYFKSKTAHMYKADFIRLMLHASKGKGKFIDKLMSCYRIHEEGRWTKLGAFKQALEMIPYYRFHSKHTFSKKYTKEFNGLIIKELKKLFTWFRR